MLAIIFGDTGCFLWREVDRFGQSRPGAPMGGPFPTEAEARADANNEGFILIPDPWPDARRSSETD